MTLASRRKPPIASVDVLVCCLRGVVNWRPAASIGMSEFGTDCVVICLVVGFCVVESNDENDAGVDWLRSWACLCAE